MTAAAEGPPDPPLADVMDERRHLLALAYRMMGTLADAEDVVQETYLRWYRLTDAERAAIGRPGAWLTRVASRIALDALGSARARRERYVGPWLPEPVPEDLFAGTGPRALAGSSVSDPLDLVVQGDAVSTALLVVLEAMTPAERVAFVLHDVFAVSFDEIAAVLDRSPAAARQLATSARRRVATERPVVAARREHDAVLRAFTAAAAGGDLSALIALLAPDAELRSDGGGVVSAARNVVAGADRVARFVLGIMAKQAGARFEEQALPDGLGYGFGEDDALRGIVSVRVVDGRIADVWIVMNPAKLTAWTAPPAWNRHTGPEGVGPVDASRLRRCV